MSKFFANGEELTKMSDVVKTLLTSTNDRVLSQKDDLDNLTGSAKIITDVPMNGPSNISQTYSRVFTVDIDGYNKAQFFINCFGDMAFRAFNNRDNWQAWKQIGGVTSHLYAALRKALATSTVMEVA